MTDKLAAVLPPLTNLIGGRWTDGGSLIPVHDKFTGAVIAEIAQASEADVKEAVTRAQAAFDAGVIPPIERARILRAVAAEIEKNRARLRDIMVAETGFTLTDSDGDISRTIVTLDICAEEATRITGHTVPFGATAGQHNRLGFTVRSPLGVVCAITPFNSPLNTVAHKIGPALAAGNSVVLKPSNLTPLSAAALCDLFVKAGLPAGYLNLVNGSGSKIGNYLVQDQRIAFYTFTGSTTVGRIIQQGAGLRRTQMELGSIASTIVCDDADLELAIPKIANASFRKAGQVCTSTQRLYLQRGIFDEALKRLTDAASAMPAGDPRRPETRVGPMISQAEAERAESWIAEAKKNQARVVLGGTRTGPVLSPTILTHVADGMRVVDEEIFAPCVVILPFDELDAAVKHSNNTPFGLSAGIFTSDVKAAVNAARNMRFGAVHINEASSARADGMPFGGVKDSGFGREGPKYAVEEMTEERLITFN
ncbi:succinate-semialdehyde dehydrogenase [Terrihabitans soli]|uniref:Succinate-semialdehyde dehydrogenase n=1 Tax=Terrihabitans soli TaxID=708113 RepID=A0A6S6QRG3_9HYPH|nr:aldehyde dehydrogenase family protein [Terrihabitans soli]BCJ92196.1 succinate-semialdehyde dehydrogenase [Terrihabitans soli]